MNKFLKGFVMSGAMLALIFSACNPKTEAVLNNVDFDTLSIADGYHVDGDSTKPSCSIKIKYVFPATCFDQNVLAKLLMEFNYIFFDNETYEAVKPADALSQYAAAYIENYKQDVKAQYSTREDDAEGYFSYVQHLSNEVLFNQSDILTCLVTSVDYRGGVDSTKFYRTLVFDLKTGEPIVEQDIFTEDYKSKLDALLLQKIKSENKVATSEELYELGIYDVDNITSNNNFLLDNKGLTYIFNQAGFATPSVGETRLFLPYNEIEYLLKKESPIAHLIK